MNTVFLHPAIVHFPIALLVIGAIAALASKFIRGKNFDQVLFNYAGISIILGAVTAAAAIISGYLFTQEMVGMMGEIRATHILLAFASVGCGLITAVLMGLSICTKVKKRPLLQNLAVICSLITAVMIGITGHYGGMMVFA